jgi:lipopolysaccharide transport system ATP-binding protein
VSIVVEGLSKRYWLHAGRPQTFQQALGEMAGALQRGRPFWALRDVSFRVEAGESVAVIGDNGAGKSTLLRLLCGLGRPTSGSTRVLGRVTALLELGAGFHRLLSGRENLYVSAIVSGMRRREVEARFDQIVDFAEVRPFIDEPLRTYSSAMQMRLAFSVAVHVDPSVLIVDEALAVGDLHFQAKCIERIEEFRRRGKTLLLVSHDMDLVRRFSHRAIHLEHGRVAADGPADRVTAAYEASGAHGPAGPAAEGEAGTTEPGASRRPGHGR